jgi:glucosamine-6-phosphate deaminase
MEVIIKPDKKRASVLAAKIIANEIKTNPRTVLGLATGSTPLLLYKELVRMHKHEKLSFKNTVCFNLDEYIGLERKNPRSFYCEMHKNLFVHIDIKPENTYIPDGLSGDIPFKCEEYENKILEAGGIDLQLLGIGHDGHLAFNEPGSSFASKTRLKTLSRETIEANSRFFGSVEAVPKHAITMGLQTIMQAGKCLLLAFGKSKAEAVFQMIEGPVSASWPATILQHHEKAIVILDEAAATKLQRKQYYNDVYKAKPDWQSYE